MSALLAYGLILGDAVLHVEDCTQVASIQRDHRIELLGSMSIF